MINSNTPLSEKDEWRTPPELFKKLDDEFDFYVDVCTNGPENALCNIFFTKDRCALNHQWTAYNYDHASCFINPPYSQTQAFLLKAEEQAKKHNITVVALVNANTDTKWFARAAKTANEIRLLTGRVQFLKPDGSSSKNGNAKGQCVIVWRGRCDTPCKITVVNIK
jgi:phage N-6-adenine-methyltransferase